MPFFKRTKRKARQQEMKRFAYQIEAQYHNKDDFSQIRLLRDFSLFRQGHSRKITNLIRKHNWQREINVFDYRFVIQAGNTPVTVEQTVFFLNSKGLSLPQFLMRPEHFFHKIGTYLGMQDIDFEEHPQFSKQYLLKGENENMIRGSFKESILHHFTIEKGWYLEGLNYYMILYKKKKVLKSREIAKIYEKGLYLYEQFLQEEKDPSV